MLLADHLTEVKDIEVEAVEALLQAMAHAVAIVVLLQALLVQAVVDIEEAGVVVLPGMQAGVEAIAPEALVSTYLDL